MILLSWGRWPREITCPFCLGRAKFERPEDELRWWKIHGSHFPTPVREALEASWGFPGVHAGGLDPYLEPEDHDAAREG